MAGEKLAKRLKDLDNNIGRSSDLVFGVVISTSPLKIKVDNRFEVGGSHLILSRMVKQLNVNVSVDVFVGVNVSVSVDGKNGTGNGSGDGGGSGSGLVWRGLQVGDKVAMLKVQKGQVYYVLERV
ncbi:DUF2577 family protein [Bavariicoccus seileri]|uniref:DUF2577 family protein n=1 Tax=Bavariicoccus seileri TaxID=549685 RepID=UPI0003B45E57|nr:DUF2577 family protein [Bavariicoccus seileri]